MDMEKLSLPPLQTAFCVRRGTEGFVMHKDHIEPQTWGRLVFSGTSHAPWALILQIDSENSLYINQVLAFFISYGF